MGNKELSKIIARIEKLEEAVFGAGSAKKQKQKKVTALVRDVKFSLNERAFVKRYTASKSGSKKFTLLVAYLAAGKVDKNIELAEIRTRWNKMKSLLGKFNMSYTDRAKINGWVGSKKYGFYNLTKEWQDAL